VESKVREKIDYTKPIYHSHRKSVIQYGGQAEDGTHLIVFGDKIKTIRPYDDYGCPITEELVRTKMVSNSPRQREVPPVVEPTPEPPPQDVSGSLLAVVEKNTLLLEKADERIDALIPKYNALVEAINHVIRFEKEVSEQISNQEAILNRIFTSQGTIIEQLSKQEALLNKIPVITLPPNQWIENKKIMKTNEDIHNNGI